MCTPPTQDFREVNLDVHVKTEGGRNMPHVKIKLLYFAIVDSFKVRDKCKLASLTFRHQKIVMVFIWFGFFLFYNEEDRS